MKMEKTKKESFEREKKDEIDGWEREREREKEKQDNNTICTLNMETIE